MAGMNTRTGQRNQTNYIPRLNDTRLKAQEAGGYRPGSYVGSTGDMFNPNNFIGSWDFVNQRQQQALEDGLNAVNRFKEPERRFTLDRDRQQQQAEIQRQQIQAGAQIGAAQAANIKDNEYMNQLGADMQREWYDRMQGRGYLYDRQVDNARQQDRLTRAQTEAQIDDALDSQWDTRSGGSFSPLASGYRYVNKGNEFMPNIQIEYDPALDVERKQTNEQLRLLQAQSNAEQQQARIQAQAQRDIANTQANAQRFQTMASLMGNLGQGQFVRYW